jgi:dihydrofolate synthase/folylpolyglutamate synthase
VKNSLDFLYSLRNQGSKFGLERMTQLCEELGNPQLTYPTIHVAGTNGKGSVCTMLDCIYRAHGYKVGLFTSPHLLELGERIRVNGRNLPFAEIEKWVDHCFPFFEKNEEKKERVWPTFFELMTAIAFLEFKKQKVDMAIIETGLGGRLDSTNVVIPELSILTSVGLDHCEILGHEIAQVASEKAGIIKGNKPVLTGWLPAEAMEVVSQVAQQQNAKHHQSRSQDSNHFPGTNLSGFFQQRNASLSYQATRILENLFPVEQRKVEQALQSVRFPGRWQKISTHPTVILDACHNGQGAEVSIELWDTLPEGFHLWFSACGEERARDVLVPLSKRTQNITFVELNQPRATSLEEFRKISDELSISADYAREKDIPKLYSLIEQDTTLLVTGSIYLISAVLALTSRSENGNPIKNWQDHW